APPPPKPLPAPRAATAPAAPPVKQQPKAPATTAAKTDAPASASPSETRIPSLNELPEDLRRQLPALTISGSSYSANPAHRMLIINGQVFHEGEKPAAELLLEQIKPNAAVLSFRGQRYSLAY
ncbi:MAG: general secretion pathway protein GspB, partial [Burkholderiaceae bacterium]